MPQKHIQSVRALARELGISHTTVSDALRNNPRVSQSTRNRVQAAARDLGYKYNPLAGAVMSEIRRSSVGGFQGTIAVVDLEGSLKRPSGAVAYHELLLRGAKEAGATLGFKVDHFVLGDGHMSIGRLNQVLESRGIRGVMILPVFGQPSVSGLDWGNLTGIYTDYLIDDPAIHAVCPDHFRSMTIALRKLIDLGYKRPGLILHELSDRRLLFRWEAAFSSYWTHHTDHELTTPLVTNNLNRKEFRDWFKTVRPDVVICHSGEVPKWMEEIGCKIPETHGYCCLNVTSAEVNASGLDLLPRHAGRRAMEMLVAQLHRNEFGIPDIPSRTTYTAKWVDGPTLRQQ